MIIAASTDLRFYFRNGGISENRHNDKESTMRPVFRKKLFWDVDYEDIDFAEHARFVIGRVVMRGNLDEWNALKEFYGLERIKSEVVKIRYLDKRTLSYLSVVLDIKKEKFRCYNTEPSIKALWDY